MQYIERGGGGGGGGGGHGGSPGGGGGGGHGSGGGGGVHGGGRGPGGGYHYGGGWYGHYWGWGFGPAFGANLFYYNNLYWVYLSGAYVPWWWMLAQEKRDAYVQRPYVDEQGHNFGKVPANWQSDHSAIDPSKLPEDLRAELEKTQPIKNCVQCGVSGVQAQLYMCGDCGDATRLWCGQSCGLADALHECVQPH